jgi:hypothetical protein
MVRPLDRSQFGVVVVSLLDDAPFVRAPLFFCPDQVDSKYSKCPAKRTERKDGTLLLLLLGRFQVRRAPNDANTKKRPTSLTIIIAHIIIFAVVMGYLHLAISRMHD